MDKIIEIDGDGKVHLPPSDAAPGGPWEAHKWADFPTHRGEWADKWWTIIKKGSRAESVHFTQPEAIAVRDALNRSAAPIDDD